MNQPLKIRPSMRASWRKCPRVFFYRWIASVEPRVTGKALITGSAYHAGLEAGRLVAAGGGSQGLVVSHATDAAAVELSKLWWQSFGPEGDEDELAVTSAQVQAYVTGYFRHFAPFDRGIQVVEAAVFDEGGAEGGTSDMVVRNLAGEVWVVEDKTTSRFDAPQAMGYALKQNDQIATYVWALRKRGIPVIGARYRQVLKTGTSQTKKETLEDYALRAMDIYTGGDSDQKYRELIVTWTDDELATLRHASAATNAQIRRTYKRPLENYPLNPLSCIGPFGPCSYLNLCARGRDEGDPRQFKPSEETPLDEGNYRRKIWSQAVTIPEGNAAAGGSGSWDGEPWNP